MKIAVYTNEYKDKNLAVTREIVSAFSPADLPGSDFVKRTGDLNRYSLIELNDEKESTERSFSRSPILRGSTL